MLETVESPHLKIGTTLANFNSFGKIPSLKDLFMRHGKGLM